MGMDLETLFISQCPKFLHLAIVSAQRLIADLILVMFVTISNSSVSY